MRALPLSACVLVLALHPALVACGDDGGDVDRADAGPTADAMPVPAGDPLGAIKIFESTYDLNTTYGDLSAAIGPEVRWQEQTQASGACTLYEFPGSQCPTPCDGVCVGTTCHPWPTYSAVGPITLTGLTRPVTLEPSSNGVYYYQDAALVDVFSPGASVTASAAGAGAIPAFSTSARGVDAIDLPLNAEGQIVLVDGEDEVLRWTPTGDGSEVRVTINSTTYGGHGQPLEAIIQCQAPDAAGELTIPAAKVAALPELSGAPICVAIDCPPSSIDRLSVGYATIPGGYVRLEVATRFQFLVRH